MNYLAKLTFSFRRVLIYLIVVSFPSLTYADDNIRLGTFGAPPRFSDYLFALDSKDGFFFNHNLKWTSIRDANLIVVFTDRASDLDFVPAVLLPAYQLLTSQFDSHAFFIPERAFRGTLGAQVVFIVLDELEAKVQRELLTANDKADPNLVSCAAAREVYDELLSQNARTLSSLTDCVAKLERQ